MTLLGTITSAAAAAPVIDPARIPRHVAIIMDGNGRWAKRFGWIRTRGHERGSEVARTITLESVRLGVKRLTLYAFSSENWSRPAHEIEVLMHLLERFLRSELPVLQEYGVRLTAIGQLDRLPERVRRTLDQVMAATAGNTCMILSLAISYGGRDELVDAARAIARDVAAGRLDPADVDADALQERLYGGRCPFGADQVDLVIRTAGEQRMSNFLPWQAVYAEFVSAPDFWPDFSVAGYHACLAEYQRRERRFGGVCAR